MNQYLCSTNFHPSAVVYAPNPNQARRLYREALKITKPAIIYAELAARNVPDEAGVVPLEVVMVKPSGPAGR